MSRYLQVACRQAREVRRMREVAFELRQQQMTDRPNRPPGEDAANAGLVGFNIAKSVREPCLTSARERDNSLLRKLIGRLSMARVSNAILFPRSVNRFANVEFDETVDRITRLSFS